MTLLHNNPQRSRRRRRRIGGRLCRAASTTTTTCMLDKRMTDGETDRVANSSAVGLRARGKQCQKPLCLLAPRSSSSACMPVCRPSLPATPIPFTNACSGSSIRKVCKKSGNRLSEMILLGPEKGGEDTWDTKNAVEGASSAVRKGAVCH